MYLWIDIETTGLDPEKDFIMEVAWFVTDDRLMKLTEGKTSMVSHQLSAVTHRLMMNEYVLDMHRSSGLWEGYIWAHEGQGTMLLTEDIEEQILQSIESVNDGWKETVMLAGASVHFDRGFLARDMPRLIEMLSHRHLDTSSIRLMMKTCGVNYMSVVKDRVAHRALDDIEETYDMAHQYFEYVREAIPVYIERSFPPDMRGTKEKENN